MKKFNLLFASMTVALAGMFTSCEFNNEDNPVIPPVVQAAIQNYFTIESATYQEEAIPTTGTGTIQSIQFNDNALQGGMNLIRVSSEEEYERFYVGLEGVQGYWDYTPEALSGARPSTRDTQVYIYRIPLAYSINLNSDIIVIIVGVRKDGTYTAPYRIENHYVESLSGDLNINLTFSNEKDVDLHLYTPDEQHIYYGNRGGSVETTDGETITFGLDHDSNAGCNIDGLNNENIYLPEALIVPGTYRIVVDMYSNCDTSIATDWAIVARYKGEIIVPTTGENPASGTYPVGAGNGDMTTVMEFTIGSPSAARGLIPMIKENTFVPVPLSDMDMMKMEEASWR